MIYIKNFRNLTPELRKPDVWDLSRDIGACVTVIVTSGREYTGVIARDTGGAVMLLVRGGRRCARRAVCVTVAKAHIVSLERH